MDTVNQHTPKLFSVAEFPDLFMDAVLRDSAGELIFASLYGRDSIALQCLASFTLPANQGGRNCFNLIDSSGRKTLVMVSHADRLEKLTGKFQTRVFGELAHLWLYDPVAVSSDRSNKRALLLRFNESEAHFRSRCWQTIQLLSSVALLDHWQQPLLEALGTRLIRDFRDSEAPPLGCIDAARIELGDHFDQLISIGVACGALTLSPENMPEDAVSRLQEAASVVANLPETDLDSACDPGAETVEPVSDRRQRLFPLGKVVATPGVHELVVGGYLRPSELLLRHQTGDWGPGIEASDAQQNVLALKEGTRIFSCYSIDSDKPCKGENRVWIITEADRSVTTLLLPHEY